MLIVLSELDDGRFHGEQFGGMPQLGDREKGKESVKGGPFIQFGQCGNK